MIKIWFDKYKWAGFAILLLAYSIGVWDVSSRVTSGAYDKERLHHVEEIIRIKQENETLISNITKSLNSAIEAQAAHAKEDRKALLDELAKDNRYSVCRVTDGVRDIYKRKLQAQ